MGDMEIKALFPGWETVRKIGTGSFGTVYEIQRDLFGKKEKAALKRISIPQNESDIDDLYGNGFDDASITAHFRNYLADIVKEYSLMAEMKGHTNVVYCDDIRYIQHDDGFGWDIYIKMELLTPMMKTLGKVVTDEQVIKLGRDLCKALVLCRSRNIIHRDIKPQNIFISHDGDYKLGDFGIAKTVEKTSGGTKIGTYNYMAPEVYNNEPYGHGADIYSLGLVMYWLLNERRMPFNPLPPAVPTASEMEAARLHRFQGEQLPAPAHGSGELKRIVLKACAFDPKDRYQSAAEMLSDLEHIGKADVQEFIPAPVIEDDGEAEDTCILENIDGEGTALLWEDDSPEQEEQTALLREDDSPEREEQTVLLREKESPKPAKERTAGSGTKQESAKTEKAPEKEPESEEDKTVSAWTNQKEKNETEAPSGKNKQKKKKSIFILAVAMLLAGAAAALLLITRSKTFGGEEIPEFRLVRKTETYLDGSVDVTEYAYDDEGNRSFGNTYRDGELLCRYVYTCDENGRIESYDWYFPVDETTPDTVVYEYDQNGRTIKKSVYSAGVLRTQSEFGYDSKGRQNKWDTESFNEYGSYVGVNSLQYDGYTATKVIRTNSDGSSSVPFIAEQSFDEQYRLIEDNRYYAEDGVLFSKWTYQYDEYGNLIEEYHWQKSKGLDESSVLCIYEYVQVGAETGYSVLTAGGAYGYDLEWDGIADISMGSWHMIGLKTDGTVVAAARDVGMESACAVSEWTDIKAVTAGNGFSLGLKEDGTVISTGIYCDDIVIDTSDWTDIKAIYAREGHAVGLKNDGTAVATGWNDLNQCGVEAWSDIKKLALGTDFTAALRYDGTVVSTESYGVSSWTDIVDIEAGGNFIAGLKNDGTVLIASNGEWGAVDTSSWTGIVKISAGVYGIVGLKADGTVVGDGISIGEDQNGYLIVVDEPNPAYDVSEWSNIVDIATYLDLTVGLKSDGTVVVAQNSDVGWAISTTDWQNVKKIYCGGGGPVGLY